MKKLVEEFIKLYEHIKIHFTNYLLILGVLLVLVYMKMAHGTATMILGVGSVLILLAFVIEINNNKKEKTTNHRRW